MKCILRAKKQAAVPLRGQRPTGQVSAFPVSYGELKQDSAVQTETPSLCPEQHR